MKPDGILINTSRGEILNEKEVLEHLNTNKIFKLGLDVYSGEPTVPKGTFDSALAQHKQVVGSHHIGASTLQADSAIGDEAGRMVLEYLKNQKTSKYN